MLSVIEYTRSVILFAHLLFFSFALVQVVRIDTKIMSGRFARAEVRKEVRGTLWFLCGLWITGALLMLCDNNLRIQAISESSQLSLKLIVVAVLTVNGIALHFMSVPVLLGRGKITAGQLTLLAVTGAISASHWLIAAFVGLARPLRELALPVLLQMYLAACLIALTAAAICMPKLKRQLMGARIAREANDRKSAGGRRARRARRIEPRFETQAALGTEAFPRQEPFIHPGTDAARPARQQAQHSHPSRQPDRVPE